jgi:hypothetical protein
MGFNLTSLANSVLKVVREPRSHDAIICALRAETTLSKHNELVREMKLAIAQRNAMNLNLTQTTRDEWVCNFLKMARH